MATLIQAQIFFFISSIGFVILGILTTIILIYILRVINRASRILKKAEKDIDSVSEITKEIIDNIRESHVFQFFFGGKRKAKK